jgi:hypothetical protein
VPRYRPRPLSFLIGNFEQSFPFRLSPLWEISGDVYPTISRSIFLRPIQSKKSVVNIKNMVIHRGIDSRKHCMPSSFCESCDR